MEYGPVGPNINSFNMATELIKHVDKYKINRKLSNFSVNVPASRPPCVPQSQALIILRMLG